MRKKIILYGHLAEKHPDVIYVEAETVAEALQVLSQFPELEHPPGEPWPVQIEGVETREDLYSPTLVEEIHVHPRTGGAGGGRGLFQIVIGAVLIAISIWNPAFLAAMSISQGSLFMTGALMVTGGILQMMMPMPETSEGDNRSSKISSGNANTTRIGTPIPLAYGTQPLYGHYLSFDVDASEWQDLNDADIEDLQRAGKLGSFLAKSLPQNSTSVGVYPLPDAVDTAIETQGIYVEFDKTPVPYAIVNPVYDSQVTGPSNIPQSSWIV